MCPIYGTTQCIIHINTLAQGERERTHTHTHTRTYTHTCASHVVSGPVTEQGQSGWRGEIHSVYEKGVGRFCPSLFFKAAIAKMMFPNKGERFEKDTMSKCPKKVTKA